MNQTTRQRITGSLVLAVTALILLPVIFDGEGSYQPAVQIDIPARPQQPVPAQRDPQRPVITADSDAIRIRPESPATVIADNLTNAAPDASTAQADTDTSDNLATAINSTAPAPTPASSPPATVSSTPAVVVNNGASPASLDPQGLPEGWSVRLGSFSNTDNASALVTRLQAAGHRAYSRRVDSSQGVLTAVFVGPLVNRAAAQTLLERLRQDFQLNGMIVRYEIDPL